MDRDNRVAVFIDFENIKRAVDDFFVNERVDLKRILDEIKETAEGRIVLKRAYADWGQFKDYRSDLLDNATEPVQAFALTYKGKNGADIRIAIDVMDVVLRQAADVTHVALVSGDSDFTPLVSKLREFGKYVIGVGVRSNTSNYLAKACDTFCYYDDLRGAGEDAALPQRSVPSTPMDPVALLATAMAALGNRPVPGSALKTQMRKLDPMFDETRHGHTGFLDFLRAHGELVEVHKPAVGDVTVALKGQLVDLGEAAPAAAPNGVNGHTAPAAPAPARTYSPGYTPYAAGQNGGAAAASAVPAYSTAAPATAADRLRGWLRENNFRHVPYEERHQIIRVMYDIFTEPEARDISLKEGKDRLHLWFEENRPAVPWESINSTVYHLFYTWCFQFDRSDADDGKQLWDRRTSLMTDIHSADELIAKCERGVVRKVWERDRDATDADALNAWLYDGDAAMRPHVDELIRQVAAGLAPAPAPAGAARVAEPGRV
jgi:uncharacterized protein (TIGR00288 family)